MKGKISYYIIELETGFKDGYYSRKSVALTALSNWDKKRSYLDHALVPTINEPYIPNEMHLPTRHHFQKRSNK